VADVQLSGVSKAFRARSAVLSALEGIDLGIGEQEFVSVVGPSGCGKSTLLRIVAGLIPPSSGEVLVHGRRVQGPPEEVGIVFQHPVLLPWRTVLGNIELQVEIRGYDLRRYRRKAEELIALVGLQGFEDSLPYQLSGGMQQRVALCRALIHGPSLLLMDEPFGALDALTREQMNLELYRVWRETHTTVMFITHSITEAVFLSQRIVVMTPRPGRIASVVGVNLLPGRSIDSMREPEFLDRTQEVRRIMSASGFGD